MRDSKSGSLILVIFMIYECAAELRFCLQGPHKVKDNQCPGGILFREKVTPKCLFHDNDGGGVPQVTPMYATDICNAAGDGTVSSTADRTPHSIQKFSMPVSASPTGAPGALSVTDCVQECLADVPDRTQPEHIDDNLPARDDVKQAAVSERLFSYMMEGEDDDQRGTPGLNIIKLFKETLEVTQKFCGEPYISNHFMEQVQFALRWMVKKLRLDKPLDMGLHEFQTIMHVLQQCKHNNKQLFQLTGTRCANKARIETITFKDKDGNLVTARYQVMPKSYRWGKFDLFIEAAWAHIDFVHSFCFKFFAPKLNHYHIFQQHLESLFTEIIKARWANPPVFKREQYWNNLARTKDVKWTMQNLDFCAQTAVHYSPFEQRLDRPFSTPLVPVPPTLTSGWTDSVANYWMDYGARGGFEGSVRDFGICAKSQAEADIFKMSIGVTCS